MSNLKDFAAFVKHEKINEFASSYFAMIKSFDVPLMAFFRHQNDDEMLESSKVGLNTFLESLINGNAIEVVKQSLQAWEDDKIPGIPKNAVSVSDILLIYAAQKISVLQYIPYFSTDAFAAIDLVFDLEMYYKEVRELSLKVLQKIQAEDKQKLIESEERYKDLFDNANDLIHIVDVEGNILYLNKAYLNALDYSLEEMRGKKIYSIIAESEREKYQVYREAQQHTNSDEHITTTLVTRNGKQIHVEGYVTWKFQDERPEYVRGIFRDVTRRKEDEQKLIFYNEQLLEREENLSRLIQNAPDAIIVIDELNIIQLWNPKAEQIFGWKPEEVLQKSLTDFIIPEEYKAGHQAGMKRLKETGVSQVLNKTTEITAVNKKKEQFFISLTISQSRQAGRNVFIAFIRDITSQKQNEIELETKRKQLENTNEELEQYAWLASHDLKEPLRKIMTFSDILITRYSKDLPEIVQKHLKKIHLSTERMDSLIEAIMVYSNVRNKNDLFVKTDLDEIANEILVDLEVAIKSKKAKISIDKLPVIDAIKIQMRQLLQNLLSNAIKYSKPDVPPVIKVTSMVKEGFVWITFTDNGIGFHSQYAEKIFQVFQRLSTDKEYEGTGIGLALCKKIVETHGGTITAESKEGEGSIFTVSLPLNMPEL